MIKTKSAIVMLLTSVAFFGMSQTVSAAPCSAEVTALKTELSNVCSSRKKCKGLNRKLNKVNRKLEKGKFRKAARKLSDFGAVVEDMATRKKPRISMADYENLMVNFYNPAAICVSNGGVVVAEVADVADPAPIDAGTTTGGGLFPTGGGLFPEGTSGPEPTGVLF